MANTLLQVNPRKPADTINRLKAAQQFALLKLLEAEFAASKKSDIEFAAHATEKLGFKITEGNVFHGRQALNLPSHRASTPKKPARKPSFLKLLEAEFAASKKSDIEFAAHATEKLGVKITEGNVFHGRQALNLPSHRASTPKKPARKPLLDRVAAIEAFLNESFDAKLG